VVELLKARNGIAAGEKLVNLSHTEIDESTVSMSNAQMDKLAGRHMYDEKHEEACKATGMYAFQRDASEDDELLFDSDGDGSEMSASTRSASLDSHRSNIRSVPDASGNLHHRANLNWQDQDQRVRAPNVVPIRPRRQKFPRPVDDDTELEMQTAINQMHFALDQRILHAENSSNVKSAKTRDEAAISRRCYRVVAEQ